MGMFSAINTAGSGLTAERTRMDVISDNIANANTTRTEDGGPYMRKVVQFEPRGEEETLLSGLTPSEPGQSNIGKGVRVRSITEADGEARRMYEPKHPDANEEGYVLKPNVDPAKEMVDMITATRAYEANVSSIDSAKKMFNEALRIAR
ncbi:MAG: flagellar basal body rod protein FlgC [bacterium]